MPARIAYDSGIFWLGRGDYQKSYNLFSKALEVCPDYTEAIQKQKEVGMLLKKQKEQLRIEEEKKLEAQNEALQRQRHEKHLQRERERAFREASVREEQGRTAQASGVIFLGSSPDVSVYVYLDTVKVLSSGLVQVWSLYDMSSQQFVNNVYIHSVKSLNVIDCKNNKIGILNDIYYSMPGGNGEVVWNGQVEMSAIQWLHVAPKSLSELKFDFISAIPDIP